MARDKNPALRAWWSVHVSAWRRSGVSQKDYCRKHGLPRTSLVRWLKALDEWEAAKKLIKERHRRKRMPLSKSSRNRAVQGFWAMHVEALRWSNLSVRVYAAAHQLSPHSLYRWCRLIDSGEVEIDWRALLHPSARPAISTKISTSAKEDAGVLGLTESIAVEGRSPKPSGRRRFSVEEKRLIVLATERPGATVSSVARAHGIVPSVLFRWRAALGMKEQADVMFATARLREAGGKAVLLQELLPAPEGSAIVELTDGRRVFAPESADPDAVRRQVAVREAGQC